jgi:hypothetical protein
MEHKTTEQDAEMTADTTALQVILGTDLGDLVTEYHQPLASEDRRHLEEELEDVQRAQAAAAARLPNLYAD